MSTTPPDISKEKTRAKKEDYGFTKTAKILIVAKGDKTPEYKGNRKDWWEKVGKFEGKTAEEFLNANAGKDSPRGWLRFFATDKTIRLEG